MYAADVRINKLMTVRIGIISIFLGLNAIKDIRKKEISIWSVIIWGFAGIIWMFLDSEFGWKAGLAGLIPGIFLAALGLLSRGAVGFGDGLLVMVTGLYLGIQAAAVGLFWGLILCAVWGMVMIFLHRGTKNTELPFAPFLLGGVLLNIIWYGNIIKCWRISD